MLLSADLYGRLQSTSRPRDRAACLSVRLSPQPQCARRPALEAPYLSCTPTSSTPPQRSMRHQTQSILDDAAYRLTDPLENSRDVVRIDSLPIRAQLECRSQRMLGRNQHEFDVILFQHNIPGRLYIGDLSVCFKQLLAVKIAAPVYENFRATLKSKDQVATPLILREHASVEIIALEKVRRFDRKYIRLELNRARPGQHCHARDGSDQNNCNRHDSENPSINRANSIRIVEESMQPMELSCFAS